LGLKVPDWRWILRWKLIYPIRHGHSYTSDYEIGVRRALLPLSGHEFWDVGANTGYYTLMLAKNFDRVRAFEPNPDAVGILTRKIAKNHYRNVQVFPVALSNSVGRSRLYLHTEVREKTIGSSNTLIPSFGVAGQGSGDVKDIRSVPFVEVETDTVDNLLGNDLVDLLKIDVEGAEFMVLNGAMKTLDEGRITNLMIELHDGKRKDELDSFLTSRHYRTKWLDYAPGADVIRVFATLVPRSSQRDF
jgi:FkbM family methyltransferase